MPYITQDKRQKIDAIINQLQMYFCGVGELNYTISKIVHNFIKGHDLRYAIINAVIGVLECSKLELYRQIASDYEDQKKELNGPVSDLDED